MKKIILDEIERGYFTNMKDIFEAIDNEQLDYNWLISCYECNNYPSDKIRFDEEYVL